jgi:hypothetical protein
MTSTHFSQRVRRSGATVAVTAALLSGCATKVTLPPANEPIPTKPRAESQTPVARTTTQQRLVNEANVLLPLAKTDLGQRFLRATDSIPSVATRTIYRDDNKREFFSPAEAEKLPAERRMRLAVLQHDEERYYYTRYGTPLANVRALELAAQNGVSDAAGMRLMDFGYGAIGHLRLLASLGANVVGVDPDTYLDALYSQPSDQGSYPNARNLYRGPNGSVTLVHAFWPKDEVAANTVSKNGPYQVIMSKNTLKRGYIKPARAAPKNQLIELGVSDEVFLKRVFDALAPGGVFIIYNISPKLSGPNETYRPWSDGRSPFSRQQFTQAGFRVVSFDENDDAFVRQMGTLLKWDQNDKGEKVDDLSTNLFGLYTVLRKP